MSENEVVLDDLLGTNVQDVEDLPEFVTLPNGSYRLKGTSFKTGKTSTKKQKVTTFFELVSIHEMAENQPENMDTNPERYPAGSLVSFMFTDAEPAKVLSRLKKAFGDTMMENGMTSFSELADNFDNLEFDCAVVARPNQNDPNQFFGDLQIAMIAQD